MGKNHQYFNHGGRGRGGRGGGRFGGDPSDHHNNPYDRSSNRSHNPWPDRHYQRDNQPPQDTQYSRPRQLPYNQSPRFPGTHSDSKTRMDSHSQSRQQALHRTQPRSDTSRQPTKDESEESEDEEQELLTKPIDNDDEWKQRRSTAEELLNLPTVDKRIEKLEGLSDEQQLMLFFPPGVTRESLLPCQEPRHFPDYVKKAHDECLKRIPELFRSEQMEEEDFDPSDVMYEPPQMKAPKKLDSSSVDSHFVNPFLLAFTWFLFWLLQERTNCVFVRVQGACRRGKNAFCLTLRSPLIAASKEKNLLIGCTGILYQRPGRVAIIINYCRPFCSNPCRTIIDLECVMWNSKTKKTKDIRIHGLFS